MHRKRKYLVLLSVFSSYFAFATAVFAYPAVFSLGVKKCSQQKPKWCWAASARSIGLYKGYDFSQTNIVTKVKGSDVNEGASDSEVVAAILYVTNYTRYVRVRAYMSYEEVQKNMCEYDPIACGMVWDDGGGHMVVIGGYDENQQVKIIDPCVKCETRYYPYSDLHSTIRLQSGTGHSDYMYELA